VFFRQCGAEIVHFLELVIVERSSPSAAISEVEDGGASEVGVAATLVDDDGSPNGRHRLFVEPLAHHQGEVVGTGSSSAAVSH
jgi:hypothetical protein